MKPAFTVLRPGPRTTLQDFGRIGRRRHGVPVAGALDRIGLRVANALVGNRPDEGCLEITLAGPVLRLEADSARIAVAGPARLDVTAADGTRRRLSSDRAWRLEHGDVLAVGAIEGTTLAYLAVEGGFAVAPVLGSLSTHLAAGLGPLDGRILTTGPLPLRNGSAGPGPDLALTAPLPYGDGPIRVVLGPQDDAFAPAAIATLLSAEYRIGGRSDRMGLRLEGPPLPHRAGADIVSDGIVAGCLQVPGDGLPILLLSDHQTTGGYTKIATVMSADLPRLGRMPPGTLLRFAAVTVAEAEAARRAQERALAAIVAGLRPAGAAGAIDLDALYRAELITATIAED